MSVVRLANLVIPNGATESNVLQELERFDSIRIQSPAVLAETVSIQGSLNKGTDFATMLTGDADITIPAARIRTITMWGLDELRLKTGGAVAAERVFLVRGIRND